MEWIAIGLAVLLLLALVGIGVGLMVLGVADQIRRIVQDQASRAETALIVRAELVTRLPQGSTVENIGEVRAGRDAALGSGGPR